MEIVEKLYEKGIEVKAPTLAKYLNESRRKQARKTDNTKTAKWTENLQADAVKPVAVKPTAVPQQVRTPGSIFVKPDTPIDEL